MKIIANEIRVGNVLEYNGRLLAVTRIAKTQPGKGGAYVQAEMKDIRDGTKFNERFRSAETVEKATLDSVPHQFLYREAGDMIALMDSSSYEQVSVPSETAGEAERFLVEGMTVNAVMYDGAVISVELPDEVTLQITEADPVVKGQTAASSYKPAVLSNGVRIMVPPFVESGTMVVIKTADGSYVKRAES